jgi:hypothetical protein
MNDSHYDTAQICTNGHVVNSMARDYPETNAPFCDECGSPTLMACPSCQTPIRGHYHVPGVLGGYEYSAPGFCHNCGAPYPWTAASLQAAKDLTDELEGLSAEDRSELKRSLDDLVKKTPQTAVAETRFKRIMKKAGKEGVDAMRSILTDVLSETIKKTLFGP